MQISETSLAWNLCSRWSVKRPSRDAKIWPQQPWFFIVVLNIVNSFSLPIAVTQSTSLDITLPSPVAASNMSSAACNPLRAKPDETKPASAALPACSGFISDTPLNAFCKPAAIVVDVAKACANWLSFKLKILETADAAPIVPAVPVVCHFL